MWTDETRAEVIEKYENANPTPENTLEIVHEIAAEYPGATPNGVRMLLTKAGVYVKKTQTESKKSSGEPKASGGTRVSKEAAQAALVEALNDVGAEVDEAIVSKLTGKAAQYFTNVIAGLNK